MVRLPCRSLETQFHDLTPLFVASLRHQGRAHPISGLKSFAGAVGENRSNRRAVIEQDHADRERRFDALALVQMHGRERMQLATAGQGNRFELLARGAAEFTSVLLGWKKHVPAPAASTTVERGWISRAGVERRLRRN